MSCCQANRDWSISSVTKCPSETTRIRNARGRHRTRCIRLVHAGRCRSPGCGGYPAPDRPQSVHDHLGRRQHLSARDRGLRWWRIRPARRRGVWLLDPEMGEQVKAVVDLMDDAEPSEALADQLMRFARSRMAHYKVPSPVDFVRRACRACRRQLDKQALRSEQLAGCRRLPPAEAGSSRRCPWQANGRRGATRPAANRSDAAVSPAAGDLCRVVRSAVR